MRLSFVLAVVFALAASPAWAQVTVTAAPNTPGATSHLKVAVDGAQPAFAGRVPRGLVLSIARGYVLDVGAAAICAEPAAAELSCPADTLVATGSALVESSFGGAPVGDVTATLRMYRLAPPTGSMAGVLVVLEAQGQRGSARGVINGVATEFAYEVRFDRLPAPPVPAGVTLKLKRLDLDAGAARTVATTKTTRKRCRSSSRAKSCKKLKSCRKGRRCPRYKTTRKTTRTRHDLLRNPSECATGSWPARAVATFDDGTTATIDAPVACVAG